MQLPHNDIADDIADDIEQTIRRERRLAATLRRMRNATVMPSGASQDDLRDVMAAGLMSFQMSRYNIGRYAVTQAGHEFLQEHD